MKKVCSEKIIKSYLNPLFPFISGWKKSFPLSEFLKKIAKNDAK
jgi:hypothetical protein